MSILCLPLQSQDSTSDLGELVWVRTWVHMLTMQAS